MICDIDCVVSFVTNISTLEVKWKQHVNLAALFYNYVLEKMKKEYDNLNLVWQQSEKLSDLSDQTCMLTDRTNKMHVLYLELLSEYNMSPLL